MTTRRSLTAVSIFLATALMLNSAWATTYQWDGGLSHGTTADNNWSTANNWVGGVPPASSFREVDLEFLGAAGRTTSNNNSSYPGGASMRSLTFDAGNTAYTLTGNPIYIGAGGIVQNSTATQTFTAKVLVAADQSWSFGAGAGALNFGGGLSIANGGSLTVRTSNIQVTGSAGLVVGDYSYPGGTPNSGPSTFNLTNDATLSAANVTIGRYGNGPNLFTQDSGTLSTGGIQVNGVFLLSGTGFVSATGLGIGSNGIGNFAQNGGSVSTNGGPLTVGSNYEGYYAMKAGGLSVGNMDVGLGNVGSFRQGGGTVIVGGTLGIGTGSGSGQGTYELGGGNLITGRINIGSRGNGTFIQTGGTVVSSGPIVFGYQASSRYVLTGDSSSVSTSGISIGTFFGTATFTVSSGSLNLGNDGYIYLGNFGPGTFTQSGGKVTFAQGGFVSLGVNDQVSGTYNLDGGTLTVGSVQKLPASSGSRGTLNLNGGTLQANKANPAFVTGNVNAYVKTGGAKIDSNGFGITIALALQHDPTLTGNALDGGLTKLGTGTLTLGGANTYNGGTLIAGGMLEAAANTALGTGNVMLGANGFQLTLDANVTNAIADTASLSLDSAVGGKLQLLGLAGSVQETVASLDINGIPQAPGTYGATGSGAQFIDDAHFSGTGILAVAGGTPGTNVLANAVPEPGSVVFAAMGMLLAGVTLRRRRKA